MTFTRARNSEQKEIRVKQICESAINQFDEQQYDDITLASIARELNFSRVNLYKYFSNKEEIYLTVTLREIQSFFSEILHVYDFNRTYKLNEFALIWSKTLYSHERLLKLCSILFSIIEKNVSIESLAKFKFELFQELESLFPLFKHFLPNLPEKNYINFLDFQLYQIAGLFPSTNLTDHQKKAVEISGVPYKPREFIDMFSAFLIILIQGLSQDICENS